MFPNKLYDIFKKSLFLLILVVIRSFFLTKCHGLRSSHDFLFGRWQSRKKIVDEHIGPPLYSRNWKLGDFSIFRKSLDDMMTSPLKSGSARILEGEVEHFHVSIIKALNKSHPVQPCKASLRKATWWNKET